MERKVRSGEFGGIDKRNWVISELHQCSNLE